MSLRRAIAIARKELRHIYRDRQTLFITLLAPAFVLFLLANTFSVNTEQVRLGLMDHDQSALSRRYVQALTADSTVSIVRTVSSYDEVDRLLVRGGASATLVIPAGFGASFASGRPAPLQLVVDGSDYFSARGVHGDLLQRTQAFFGRARQTRPGPSSAPMTVSVRSLYNPTLEWLFAMTPGLMAAAFCFPAIAVALACTREVEHGSYEILLSTPMRISEYLVGKLTPYLAVGSLGALLSWVLSVYWFKVPFRGDLDEYLLLALVFLLSLMSMSVLVGTAARDQRHAIVIIVLLFFVPTFFMSGLLRPLEAGSPFARVIRWVLPAANYVSINRALFLKGLGVAELGREVGNLLRISGVALAASLLLARRKLA